MLPWDCGWSSSAGLISLIGLLVTRRLLIGPYRTLAAILEQEAQKLELEALELKPEAYSYANEALPVAVERCRDQKGNLPRQASEV